MAVKLAVRRDISAEKKLNEEALKELDQEIKQVMRDHNVDKYVDEDSGFRMKLVDGTNQSINKKKVVKTLSEAGWTPDQIQWFMNEVTDEVKYQYVDVRAVKQEEV